MVIIELCKKCDVCFKSSHRRCSIKKAVLKNFAKFTGKHLCWNLFKKKLQALGPTTLLKRDSNTGVFCEYCQIFKNTYFEEHLPKAASEIFSYKVGNNIINFQFLKYLTIHHFITKEILL